MKNSFNFATMLAVAGGLTMAVSPTAAVATCSPSAYGGCSAFSTPQPTKPRLKKAKKVKVAKAGGCAAAPCAASDGGCAAAPCSAKAGGCSAAPCAAHAGGCAAKCGPKA